jgi:signal transduction histidine kinase
MSSQSYSAFCVKLCLEWQCFPAALFSLEDGSTTASKKTTRRAKGGTGLGLYIVHNLVTEQLGGRITLISAPGKGTSICMTLPRA